VFTRPRESRLTGEHHEQLWKWFSLPAFEQVRGASDELLAYECEAREGFHLAPGVRASLLGGAPCKQECPCGESAPRMRPDVHLRTAAAGD